MLDPWRLRLLTLLESLGTVRAVAAAARLSPSSVSEQLAVLEREAAADLFERAGRRLRLTPAGVALSRHARLILDQMDAAREELATLDADPEDLAGRVRIGAFTSALNTFVLAAVRDLGARHPRLRVTVWELDPSASVTALQRGDCDIVITAAAGPPTPDVLHTPLTADNLVLVTPLSSPSSPSPASPASSPFPAGSASSAGPVDLADFAGHGWSVELPGMWGHAQVHDACRRAGFEPDVVARFASYGPMLAHIEAGLSVTLLPELAVDPRYRVSTRPLRDPIRREITAAVRAGSATRPTIHTVLTTLTTTARRP